MKQKEIWIYKIKDADMKENDIKWFIDRIYENINLSEYFFKSDIQKIKDEKGKKRLKKMYPIKSYKALDWVNSLNEQEQENIEILIKNYTCDTCRYFFRLLEEGEVSYDIGRINFELKAINDTTGKETILISADENDDIDNDFEGLVLDKCIETEEDNN